jgi:hypothetical protein
MADRIQARAIRRCGELLKEIQPAKGTRTDIEPRNGGDTRLTRAQAAEDAGLSKRQKDTALRVASVPAEEFEEAIESDKPPTVTELAERGKQSQPKPLVDLEGRDREEFAASTRAQGAINRLVEVAESFDPTVIVRGTLAHEQEGMNDQAQALIDWLGALQKEIRRQKKGNSHHKR